MAANDLVTLAQAKAHLNIQTLDTTMDTQLSLQIEVASQMIEDYVDRKLKSQSITEVIDGRRDNRLILKQWPVTAITEVRVDSESVFTGSETLIDSSEYRLSNEQEVVLLNGHWSIGYQNIKVVYVAGYTTVPPSLRNACLQLIEYLEDKRNQRDIGNTSKGKGGESIGLVEGIPKLITDQLDPYQRMTFPLGEIPNTNW